MLFYIIGAVVFGAICIYAVIPMIKAYFPVVPFEETDEDK